ncbi:MAG TPA: hypothetical protein VEX15_21555 [Nocardioidaceae bacterium]|nr:hypothetical protein [Nocardioidaceae bacterium]
MSEQRAWQQYARLVTRVAAAGADEQRRQDTRRVRRATEREDAETMLKAAVQQRQRLEQRVRELEAHAAGVLQDANVSTSGERVASDLAPVRDVEDADSTIDRLTRELDEVASELRKRQARRGNLRSRMLTVAIVICAPIVVGSVVYVGGGNWFETVAGAIVAALAAGLGWRSRTGLAPVIGAVLAAGIVWIVVAAFGWLPTGICLVVLTGVLIAAHTEDYYQRFEDRFRKDQ